RVDHFPAGTNDLPDLFDGNLDHLDPGSVGRQVRTRGTDDLQHALQDVDPTFPGLLQGRLEDFPGDPADLDIHLQGRHAVAGTGHLEVLVTQRILHPLDVAEDREAIAVLHQPHGDTRHRLLNRYPRIHQGQRGTADAGLRG